MKKEEVIGLFSFSAAHSELIGSGFNVSSCWIRKEKGAQLIREVSMRCKIGVGWFFFLFVDFVICRFICFSYGL